MAVQTEVKVLGKKQFFEVCLVGVVALGAFAVDDRRMTALCLRKPFIHVRVAFHA